MSNIRRVLAKLNVAAKLCEAALGPKHPVKYRVYAGLTIMAVGVGISKAPAELGWHVIGSHFIADMVGYFVHGVGCIPFIDVLIKNAESAGEVVEAVAEAESTA